MKDLAPERMAQTIIQDELDRIESEEEVKILYACESGSRAWGFESKDSDYDVRFFYIRPPAWYLSVQKRRDVIERMLDDGLLDLVGWDLPKTRVTRTESLSKTAWISIEGASNASDRLGISIGSNLFKTGL